MERETYQSKRGRPRKENKTEYTTMMMSKDQRDRIDNYMWDHRLKMSYSKFIDYCLNGIEQAQSKTEQIENLLNDLKSK